MVPRQGLPSARRGFFPLFLTVAYVLGHIVFAQNTWELAVCAPISAYPASDRDRGGFDIEIAELLAQELGATVTITWTNFDETGIRDTLHAGICDAAIGVGEGVANMLTTVPYLQAPFVFVTRSDSRLAIASLDDPQLRELRVGTYQFAVPTIALRNRGIHENVTEYAAIVRPTGVDPHMPVIDAVVGGEVDVAIVYGPVAAGRALDEPGTLSIAPVTPDVDFGSTFLQLSRILTIGVRPHDVSLRDNLNRALASRWDDVIAILDDYGVPQRPLSRPTDIRELDGASRVGVIVPAATPALLQNASTGEDALRGLRVAQNYASLSSDPRLPFLVELAHAPTLGSVERSAHRLILLDGVEAVVGGYDSDEVRSLVRIAAEHGVPYFNVGSEDDTLRDSSCYPTTFHIPPSASMMTSVMASIAAQDGEARVFALAERGTGTADLLDPLREMLSAVGSNLVGSALVDEGQFVFFPTLEQIRDSGADKVFMLMHPDSQEALVAQAASVLPEVAFVGLATSTGQSRPFLQRFSQVSPRAAAEPRVVVWDPAADLPLNDTFVSRTGEPMEPIAWTTYAAVVAAYQADRMGALASADELRAFLTDVEARIDVGKAEPVTFRASDGQMIQELYVTRWVPDASWDRTAAARTSIARVAEVVTAELTAGLSVVTAECMAR